jgi:hypothetical protein
MLMKKVVIIGLIIMLCGCCATIKESEFFKHDSVYNDFSHWGFSWIGYRTIDQNDVMKSKERNWWGITKEYKPEAKK